jgi:uncharacterized protein (DUF2235 family)
MAKTTPQGFRRLALCLDGTWNTMDSRTNVARIFKCVADGLSGCNDQQKLYEEGVGTTLGEKVRGGAFGLGLDRNIRRAYCWLVNNYKAGDAVVDAKDPKQEQFSNGDEIFILGFSRGAYTARSVAGMVNRIGVLKREELENRVAEPDSPLVKQAWDLYQKEHGGEGEARDQPEWREFRAMHCHTVKIKFVGVWDTVGALGVPLFRSAAIPLFTDSARFHDTQLGRVIENAYHAIAIDEHRQDYNVTLWSAKHPVGTESVEQRWFPGAHANVGGGYEDDLLPDIPLLWMAKNAVSCGLEFSADMQTALAEARACLDAPPLEFALDGNEYMSSVRDSYGEFMFGTYRFLRGAIGKGRCFRRMLVPSDGVNQTVDSSATLKWNADNDYRPANLVKAGRIDAGTALPANVQIA